MPSPFFVQKTVVVNYTSDQIASIKSELNLKYNSLICKSAKEVLYKVSCCNLELLKELFLYKWAIDDYVVNSNGQPQSEVLTPEEFTCIAQRIKDVSC